MQKHVGLASTKTNQTRWDSHDNMFSDYHPYIDLSNHTHHNLPCLHTTHIQSHTLHNTQYIATTHSPSQLHILYTQNSLNAHHKLLVHIHNYSHIQHHQSMQLHGHTPHHKPLHLQANKSSTTTSTCTIVVGT